MADVVTFLPLLGAVLAWALRHARSARVAQVERWAASAVREAAAHQAEWRPIFELMTKHLKLSASERALAENVAREVGVAILRAELERLGPAAAKVAAELPR